jgi:hypothetical protein
MVVAAQMEAAGSEEGVVMVTRAGVALVEEVEGAAEGAQQVAAATVVERTGAEGGTLGCLGTQEVGQMVVAEMAVAG